MGHKSHYLVMCTMFLLARPAWASHTCTTCYVSPTGDDAQSGATKALAWQHAPGMPAATANAASQVPVAGDSIIFEGGGVWHLGDSGQVPYVGACAGNLCWNWQWSGDSGKPIYIGVDLTWFTGTSFTRPIFNGDNLVTTSRPASCNVKDFSPFNALMFGASNHIRIDNFELVGFCNGASGNVNAGMIGFGGTDAIIENSYFHGYTITTATTDDEYVAIHGVGNSNRGDLTNQCLFNVFDNSDGTFGDYGTFPSTGRATMEAIQTACTVVGYSVFNRVSNGEVGPGSIIHDSLFTNMYDPSRCVGCGIGPHGNIWNVDNDGLFPLGPQAFYNNVMFNINEGVGVWFQQNPVGYYFNNISWNISNYPNCLVIGGSNPSSGLPATTMYVYNNTWDSPCQVKGNAPGGTDPSQNGPVHFSNNHLIGFGVTTFASANDALYVCGSGATCDWIDDGNELFQTEATANAQGYTQGDFYAPPNSSGSTVNAGLNHSSQCSTFSSDSALCSQIGSVKEVAGKGGMAAFAPAFSPVARGATWDIGAHEFADGGSTLPSPPVGVVATVR
jgi:hypothetical protein